MIKLTIGTNGKLVINMEMDSPYVYLDLCAFMDISRTDEYKSRFREILFTSKGTLLISWMHLLELSNVRDQGQLDSYTFFLDSVMSNLAFIDISPEKVIAKENDLLRGKREINPPLNERILSDKIFAPMIMETKSMNPLSFKSLIKSLGQNEIIKLKNEFHLELNSAVNKINDSKVEPRLKKIEIGNINYPVRYVAKEITKSILREKRELNSNTWRDIFHTIVPISYCQYVLLDKGAAHRAKVCISRLKQKGYEINIKIFNNINDFLINFSEAIK